ncbi:MAG: acyl-CoA dehydrogenase [Candidatus Dadabacteria bacterium]|nr:MAG: acyl-CoA dehydrogenase [Candidatus Dadabacteria bacterium]
MTWCDRWDFNWSNDLLEIKKLARSFAKKEVAPLAKKIDEEHSLPKELLKKLAEIGFFGIFVPSQFNGSDLSHLAYCVIIEELAAVCASTAIVVSAHNSLAVWPILTYGTQEQKEKFLKPLASGEKIGCFALSEPGTGSDAASLCCQVKIEGDKFIINGTKNWITNAPIADVCVLFATKDKSSGHKGVMAFVHPLNLKGITIGKPENKLGICGSPTSSISYDNVVLTKENLLSREEKGFKIAMNTLNGGRIGVAAQALGIARASINAALSYGTERKTFNTAIVNHQLIQDYLAQMLTKYLSARLLTHTAAKRKDKGLEHIIESSLAKLSAAKAAMYCSDKALQIHGGYGYVKEYDVERFYRDAKITEIYEGTSEIQKIVIAKRLVDIFLNS